MKDVSIRELRNQGREVVDRVLAGESLIVTRSGTPVAELRPVPKKGLTSEQLLVRWRHLPIVDGARLKEDLDAVLDPSL